MRSMFLLCLLALAPLSSFASSPLDQIMTVKERLRIHLWNNGIQPGIKVQERAVYPKLPVELEVPLRKI